MSILQSFGRLSRFFGGGRTWRRDDAHCAAARLRVCKFENLEVRNPLTANPFPDIHLGSVYLEQASGDDSKPNLVLITFQGGAPGTQLSQIVINGDKDHNGTYSSGEIFFDTAAGGMGDFASNPFAVDALHSTGSIQVTGVTVADGGQQFVINFSNFHAGDIFAFTIDVDEAQFVDTTDGSIDTNSLVEGNEFQRTIMTGSFAAPHYQNAQASGLYFDAFNTNFSAANTSSGTTLSLPPDSDVPPSTRDLTDLTAGAVLTLHQEPLPSSIAGTVYHDKNLSNLLDPGEQGISSVSLTLFQWDGTQWVTTGKIASTDASGNYIFNNVLPGTYRVAETQPAGWISVGSQPGTVEGAIDGVSTDADRLSNIVLLGGQDGIHYNFGECLPASVSGKVWADTNGDCVYQPGIDPPLSGVQIDLRDSQGSFITSTTTDVQGNYSFIGLNPDTYQVFEHQPAGYKEGMDMVGTVAGVIDGVHGGTDLLSQIVLGSGSGGINYNFCEYLPVSISGKVWDDVNGDCVYQPQTDRPLSGVTVDLRNSQGQFIKSTTTNSQGQYKFDDLDPGAYQVFEHQPAGYHQGMDMVGTVNGVIDGVNSATDLLSQIALISGQNGINYDFCEYIPAKISGKVWDDVNNDCVYQNGTDRPLAGVQIDLRNTSGAIVATTTTNALGEYQFDGLEPGTYSVFEHQPAGYKEGMDLVGTIGGVVVGQVGGVDLLSNVTLTSGANGINYNFCEYLPVGVSGKVWDDVNGDCVYQPSIDRPLAGVQIDLRDNNGLFIRSTTTNAQGQYKFDDLDPGTYQVFEHQPTGYHEGMDLVGTVGGVIDGVNNATDLLSQIALTSGQAGINYDFCEYIPAKISGKVWDDVNGDCIYQPGTDRPLAGVQIDLRDSTGAVIATTTTNALGEYQFDDLHPSAYEVFEHQPAGYHQGMDLVGTIGGVVVGQVGGVDLLTKITLTSGANGINYNFCEYIPARISGKVWDDVNGDCVYQPSTDKPIAGVQIDLLNGQGQFIASTTTNAQGEYEFDDLDPGTYEVFEHQPAGYHQGMDLVGTVGDVTVGQIGGVDLLTKITLTSGAAGIHYDFCESLPNSISGHVHADPEGDCIIGPHDIMLAGVQIDLLDAAGHVIATTTTNAQGYYEFTGLNSGTYGVFEHQPAGYFDDGGDVGSLGGVVNDDLISQIVLISDNHGIDYDFCEHLPSSIQGSVHLDPEADCEIGPHDIMLSGVKVDLLDSQGHIIATTTTNAQGIYTFDNLDSGTYSVRVHPLPQYFDDGGDVGSLGGVANGDVISQIALVSDDHGVDYDFCFHPPASISGYVFQDGPPIILQPGQPIPDVDTIRDGLRTPDDRPIAGVTLLLYNSNGNPVLDSSGQQRTAVTDSNGFYQFTGLDAGTYIVREFQPAGFIDSIDTPGTTSGVAINHNTPPTLIPTLPFDPNFDAIVTIHLSTGQNSQENNFSEVIVNRSGIIEPPENPQTTIPPLPNPSPTPLRPLVIPPYQPLPHFPDLGGGDALGFTWHLSIVDAGAPRGSQGNPVAMRLANISIETAAWMDMNTVAGQLTYRNSNGDQVQRQVMGFKNAIPVVGDFDGDGIMELGFYVDGQWFIDLNGDGRWDANDLWAKMGTRDDQPVVGDWNGDGKDDIGLFGPAWPRDPQAVVLDRGLPSPLNKTEINGHRKKNIPPTEDEAASGHRDLRRGETGKIRSDLIDHVFHYGAAVEKAIVGDWMGTGLRHIAVFRNGKWYLDIDGDGRLTDKDLECEFGQQGDIPVVGDWTGDGIEKIGVYRNGRWILDTNNNHQLDPADQIIELGQAGDTPVVGKFDGSGKALVGVYHTSGSATIQTAAKPSAAAAAPKLK